jgi:micrococcal nuclease
MPRALAALLLAAAAACTAPEAPSSAPGGPPAGAVAGAIATAGGRADPAGATPDSLPACTVRRVVDGDTVRCTSGERVRLLLIDAPEMGQEELGLRSRLALEALVPAGTVVRLELDVHERDRWGRLLAHLHTADGVWVNREMVARGYAVVLVFPPNVRHVEALRAAMAEARRERRGLWAEGGFACRPADRRRGRC